MIRVEIEGIVINLLNNSPVVILKSAEGKILPIVVGIFEAQSILFSLEEVVFPRPLTHDLMKNIIETAGYAVEKLEIFQIKDNVYYANVVIKGSAGTKKIDCRPSDGIALALRCGVSIFAEEKLLQKIESIKIYDSAKFLKSNKLDKPIDKKEAENFRKIIEQMSAKEFWERLKKK